MFFISREETGRSCVSPQHDFTQYIKVYECIRNTPWIVLFKHCVYHDEVLIRCIRRDFKLFVYEESKFKVYYCTKSDLK